MAKDFLILSEGLEPIFSMSVFKYSFASIPLAIAVGGIEKNALPLLLLQLVI